MAIVDARGVVVGLASGSTRVAASVGGVEATGRISVRSAGAPATTSPPTTRPAPVGGGGGSGGGGTTPTTAPPPTESTSPPVRSPGAVSADTGGESPGFVVRCTLMVGSQLYTGPAAHQCKGGAEVSSVGAGASSARVTTDAVKPGPSTWIRWEVAARNSAGTGAFGAATVSVPSLVGVKTWNALPARKGRRPLCVGCQEGLWHGAFDGVRAEHRQRTGRRRRSELRSIRAVTCATGGNSARGVVWSAWESWTPPGVGRCGLRSRIAVEDRPFDQLDVETVEVGAVASRENADNDHGRGLARRGGGRGSRR